jgi:hypothetical protein
MESAVQHFDAWLWTFGDLLSSIWRLDRTTCDDSVSMTPEIVRFNGVLTFCDVTEQNVLFQQTMTSNDLGKTVLKCHNKLVTKPV